MAFNSTIAGIEEADAILLVGSNIRWEAPLIATRVRKAARKGAAIFAIGPAVDLGMRVTWLGEDLKALANLPTQAAEAFAGAAKPALIVGPGALGAGALGAALKAASDLNVVRDGWNGFNVVHTSAARMAGLLLGFAQKRGLADIEAANPELILLLGADEVPEGAFAKAFKVYVGHHGDAGARQADLVLPGAAYAEKHGTFVNLEGRVQRAERATFPPGDAREDWAIFRAVSELIGKTLPFNSFSELRAAMVAAHPQLGREGLIDLPWAPPKLPAKASGTVGYAVRDFWLTNAICRHSPDDAALQRGVASRRRRAGGGGVSTLFIIAGALSVGILGFGLILWFSMRMTDRKEASHNSERAASSSDGSGGYQVPIDVCGSDGGGCDS